MPDDILPETSSGAAGLAEALREYDAPVAPDGDAAPAETAPMDEFLAAFADEPAPTPEEPAKPDPVEPVTPEGDDIDAIAPPERASQAAKDNFSKIKESAKSYKLKLEAAEKLRTEELATRDAELETLRKQVAELPEAKERAAFAEEAERELAISRVEGTREFKDTILKPMDAIEAKAVLIAKSNDLDLDDVLDALAERDSEKQSELLNELVSSLKPVDQQKLIRMAEDSVALLTKRDEIRSRATEAKKELEEITKANETKAQAKARKEFESAADQVIAELRKRIPFIPQVEGETADAMFERMLEKVKASDFDKSSITTKATATAASVLLPRVTRQLVEAQAKIKTLEARISEGNTGRPTVGGDTVAQPTADDTDDFLAVTARTLGMRHSSHTIQQALES